MEVVHRKCAGLEVHEDVVIGCARVMIGHKVIREPARFARTARGLLGLVDWLAKHAVTHVAVDAEGAGWGPVWHVLSGRFEVVLMAGQGAAGDDAQGLAEALAQGRVQGGVAAPAVNKAQREMIETREAFGRDASQHARWILDLLESCGLKLAVVTVDIVGVTGRALLEALIAGEEDPQTLAALAQGLLRARRGALVDALPGRIADHQRYLLGAHLRMIENLEQGMAALEVDLERALFPVPGDEGTVTA